MVGNHKVKNMCGLEVLETPGQAGFLMVFCQFPWSMGGYHHLWDSVPQETAEDVKEGGVIFAFFVIFVFSDFFRISALKVLTLGH